MQKRAMLAQLLKVYASQASNALLMMLTATGRHNTIGAAQTIVNTQLQTFIDIANATITAAGKPTTAVSMPKYMVDFALNMPKLINMLIKRAAKIRFRQQTVEFWQQQVTDGGATLAQKLAEGTATSADFIAAQQQGGHLLKL